MGKTVLIVKKKVNVHGYFLMCSKFFLYKRQLLKLEDREEKGKGREERGK